MQMRDDDVIDGLDIDVPTAAPAGIVQSAMQQVRTIDEHPSARAFHDRAGAEIPARECVAHANDQHPHARPPDFAGSAERVRLTMMAVWSSSGACPPVNACTALRRATMI